MWCCKRWPAFASVLVVAACGFRPLYLEQAEDPSVTAEFARVKVLNVVAAERLDARLGQKMHNHLLDRLNPDGRPSRPLYRLAVTLKVSKERTGVRITDEATRARLTLRAEFKLFGSPGQKLLTTGTETSINSYNIVDSEFATLSAENDAAERAVREISDTIKLRLGLYFQRQREASRDREDTRR